MVRELACGKLRLRRQVAASAAVFAARKTAPGRQRKIWNGSQLSELAARPPKPERLADPSTFLDIVADPTKPIYYSKRDAETFFDVLQVPSELQPWFGQPAVKVSEVKAVSGWTLHGHTLHLCG